MPIHKLRCEECGHTFELLQLGGLTTALDRDDDEEFNLYCPARRADGSLCNGEGNPVMGTSLLKGLGGEAGVSSEYPRWDHGLGCHVRDAKHHRWLLTHTPDTDHEGKPIPGGGQLREIPLRPTDGDVDWESLHAEDDRARDQSAAEYREYIDEMKHGPNREAYGKLVEILQTPGGVEELFLKKRRA